jgi:hypothetical protein
MSGAGVPVVLNIQYTRTTCFEFATEIEVPADVFLDDVALHDWILDHTGDWQGKGMVRDDDVELDEYESRRIRQ